MIDALTEALTPTWQEVRTAGRVRRHTGILRGLAHELSAAPNRPGRPANGSEARQRFDDHLARLLATTPRGGLGAATGEFIDGLIARTARYTDHLFHCFDDPRIPANTNNLERFFGCSKRVLRHTLGCGSTTNTVIANLGAEPLLAFQQLRATGTLKFALQPAPKQFLAARRAIAVSEVPGIRRRSMVRYLDRHVERLRSNWLSPPAAEPDA